MNKKNATLSVFFKLAWKISPSYIILIIINSVVSAARVLSNVILPKYLIDELVGNRNPQNLILFIALIVGTNLLLTFLSNTLKRAMDIKNEYMQMKFPFALSDKLMRVEYHNLENPYYLDLRERAKFAITNQSALENILVAIGGMLRLGFTLIGLMAVMFSLSYVLVILLIISVAIMLFVQSLFAKYQVKFYDSLMPVNRKYGYYVGITFEPNYHKDIRLFDMSEMIGDRITMYNEDIASWFRKYLTKEGIFLGIYQVINVLQNALAYGYVGLRCLGIFGNKIGLGSLSMYVNAAIGFSTSITDFGKNIVTVEQMLSYLDPFMELMSLPDEDSSGGSAKLSEIKEIEFDNVSFSYPGSDVLVLNGISFKINGGEKISIVGLNGAGKSTIVKLLCRLYKPNSGIIRINGTDIYEYDNKSFMKKISAVFQDFKLFRISVEENITGKDEGTDTETATLLIDNVGLKEKIDSLPEGIKSKIGKAFDDDGIELSGGQSQKIAIARALYKNAEIIVLDEPTSALDPLAEAEIYENFNALVGDKTALYISHRMSSSVFCDKILVLDGGKIIDFDTHNNLMHKDCLYRKMFEAQAINYKL